MIVRAHYQGVEKLAFNFIKTHQKYFSTSLNTTPNVILIYSSSIVKTGVTVVNNITADSSTSKI